MEDQKPTEKTYERLGLAAADFTLIVGQPEHHFHAHKVFFSVFTFIQYSAVRFYIRICTLKSFCVRTAGVAVFVFSLLCSSVRGKGL